MYMKYNTISNPVTNTAVRAMTIFVFIYISIFSQFVTHITAPMCSYLLILQFHPPPRS